YNTSVEWQPIQIYNLFKIKIDANHLTPEQVESAIKEKIKAQEFNNTIITIRVEGTLVSGKPSDINFKEIFDMLYEKSAFFVMKNTNKLTTSEFEEIKTQTSSIEDIESSLIKEHLQQIKVTDLTSEKEEILINDLMINLSTEKQEGETVAAFENRLKTELKNILSLE
ncbi:hypothetical protein KY342_05950, partial [Candidatus Woesearchaeota archaeon]|nr:hypothetical protein [Candidatus Woesearchaeota archaeon]